ncbi:MAG: ABC transporter ATP-binding protein [Burkholderiaceae bacterium]|jgi:putative ABC transport system ATP-binding protein|nr:ABC transporter ATP-binding protein [Burkholderiaceae bacterium]
MEETALKAGDDLPRVAVSLRNVLFSWRKQREAVLDIPDFLVRTGESVFISGPSGSGKSTLLNLIAGILSPSAGDVVVNGTSLGELNSSMKDIFRGDNIGFIFQQFNLIPYLSVLDNVLIPCRFSRKRNGNAEDVTGSALKTARMLLENLDLPAASWNRRVIQLSVGQQQRVAAARALIGNPSLLIADEPTSSLDTDGRKMFLKLLLAECKKAGSTLLFVSHDQTLADMFPVTVHLPALNRAHRETL